VNRRVGKEVGNDATNPSPIGIQVDDIRFVLEFQDIEFVLEFVLELITLESLYVEPFPKFPFEFLIVAEFIEQQCSVLEAEKEG